MRWLRGILAAIIIAFAAPSGAVPKAALLTSYTQTCSEAEAFVARAGFLDVSHINGYRDVICTLVQGGVWSGIDTLYVLGTQTTTAALLNLKSTSYPLTPTNSPTFTADRGYAGNGTTSFVSSTYNPGDGGGPYNYTQNSASLFAWVLDYGSTNQAMAYGAVTSDGQRVGVGNVGQTPGGRANSGSTLQSTVAVAPGFVMINRDSAASSQAYANGYQTNTDTAASVAVLNQAWACCGKVRGLFTTQLVSIAGSGRSFTQAEQATIYQALCLWQRRVGAASC